MSNQTLMQNVYNLGHRTGHYVHTFVLSHSESLLLAQHRTSIVETVENLPSYLHDLPLRYRTWWVNLVSEDPIHVVIETVLICFVLYMILWRRASTWKDMREKLTEREKDELILEWKERERRGLVPTMTTTGGAGGSNGGAAKEAMRSEGRIGSGAVVERVHGQYMTLRLPPSGNSKKESGGGRSESMTVLNFATHDFLGMASSDDDDHREDGGGGGDANDEAGKTSGSAETSQIGQGEGKERDREEEEEDDDDNDAPSSVKGAARAALKRYGCGSCGPRGFYGTIDAHLHLESTVSSIIGTESAIMYSDGASASTSTIAAFAKRGDLLVVDEGIYEALGTGVTLSRANVKYFRHNDMSDLRRVLERIRQTDANLGRRSADQRRFIVVEGLYKNWGTVAPLDELARLKAEFSYRLVVDESFSFGTLGKTGRGAVEHFGLQPMVDVEIMTVSLENALGSIGGVCVGSEEVVDHQRLSGAGYCFSASAPPFVASAAKASLRRIQRHPELLERLSTNRSVMYRELECGEAMGSIIPERLVIASDDLSALVFLELAPPPSSSEGDGQALEDMSRDEQVETLDAIANRCLHNGLAIVSTGRHVVGHLHNVPPPALRLTVSTSQTEEDVRRALRILRGAVLEVMGDVGEKS